MDRTIRITIAQINTTVGDLAGNVEKAIDALREAEVAGSDLVVYPELTIPGYPPEDLLLKPGFIAACEEAFNSFCKQVGSTVAVIGTIRNEGGLRNAAAVVSDGKAQCWYDKSILPNYGVFDEKRYFTAGNAVTSFRLGDIHVGLSICEDTWIPNGPHKTLAEYHHVDCILNLSASPFHAGKIHERRDLLAIRSQESDAAFVYANLVGGQDELVFDGGSMVYDGNGKCLLRAPLFEERICHIDMTFPEKKYDTTLASAVITGVHSEQQACESIIAPDLSIEEEVLAALVTGTRDYIRKNGFGRVVIGLSGGIDSSLVAAVAVEGLGAENVVGVTMPSQYTSTGTRTDAEVLARNLGIEFHEIAISPLYDAFETALCGLFKDCTPDVTEENLQARIRGMLLMALSNKFGWLVLTTGNKSEMATGYATLYGDMAGGFAVIKDVPKTMVFAVSRLINDRAGREIIPESVIVRPPSAELRPDQQDSDSLPPYDILDGILKAYIENDEGINAITAHGYDRDTVSRVVGLVDRSEYKRRQAPPGVKITPRAFGRDRRLPITNRFRGDSSNNVRQAPERTDTVENETETDRISLAKPALIAGISMLTLYILMPIIIFLLQDEKLNTILALSGMIEIVLFIALYFLLAPAGKSFAKVFFTIIVVYNIYVVINLFITTETVTFSSIVKSNNYFFGLIHVILGYLIIRSGYIPKWMGILVVIFGAGTLIDNIATAVGINTVIFDIMTGLFAVPALFAYPIFGIWLLIDGWKLSVPLVDAPPRQV